MVFQNRHGGRWFHAEATFLRRKNSRPEVYTDVHFWTGYFQKANGKGAAAHKLILNVAEAARMPLVLNSNQFACKLAAQK